MVRDIDQGIAETYRRIDGVTVSLDADKCIGCGICSEGCFVRAITITDGKCILDDAKCRGCGRCTEQCPTKAITLEYDASVIQAEADRILALVNP
jgi:ferredoxin